MRPGDARGLVAAERPCYRKTLRGSLENMDALVPGPDIPPVKELVKPPERAEWNPSSVDLVNYYLWKALELKARELKLSSGEGPMRVEFKTPAGVERAVSPRLKTFPDIAAELKGLSREGRLTVLFKGSCRRFSISAAPSEILLTLKS